MSRINDLIKELCPAGVEYKTLDKVCKINKGKQLNKDGLLVDGLYPVIDGGIAPSGYWNEYNYNEFLRRSIMYYLMPFLFLSATLFFI